MPIDLCWHPANCAACNASMDKAEAQLRRFDESRFTTLNALLKSFPPPQVEPLVRI
jgi:hypothetical protein